MVFLRDLAALLAVLATSTIALDEDFGFDVSDDLELEFSHEVAKKFWEMPDMKAAVGRVFHLEIPRQAFGEIIKYDAKVNEKETLPSWLLLEKSSGVFWGVPTSHDVGSLHIKVTAIKKTESISKYFTLTVHEEITERPENCTASEDITVLTLLIDRDINAIKPKQRVVAINNIAKFFGLSYSAFKLESLLEPDDISDSSVILAGPGNSPSKESKSVSEIYVPVGCDGRLWLNSVPLVHQLKQQARDGTISEVLALPFIGWRVKIETPLIRNKRNTADGSGDYDDEYDYDEYSDYENEYNESELGNKPTPATTPSTIVTSKTVTSSSTQIEAETENHPHRHHHGEIDPILIDIESEDEVVPETTTLHKVTDVTPKTTELKEETTSRPSSTTKTTIFTTQPTSTTHLTPVVTQPTTDNSKLDDDYDYTDYDEDDDDVESETVIPTVPDVEKKTEAAKETTTIPTTTVAFTVKVQPETVEFIPETTPTTSTTSTTTTTTTVSPTTTATITTTPPATTTIPTTTTPTTTSSTTSTSTSTTEMPTTTIKEITTTIVEDVTTEIVTEIPNISTTLPTTTEKLTTQEETTFKQTTLRHITTTTRPATRIITETIDLEVKNIPPQLQNRLKRIAVTAGKLFSFFIPEDTFLDLEDGKNLTFEFLDNEGRSVGKRSWCQFNPKTREIYGLPLEEDVSRWVYQIKATDKEGASTSDHLEILVQHHKSRRAVNHEFTLYIQIEKKWEFPHLIDWPLKTLKALKTVYHLKNISEITVRNVDYNSVPAVFSWTNDSLPTHICPKEAIEKIFNVMTANSDGDPSHSLARALAPELRVKKVAYHGLGLCEPKPHPAQTPQTHVTPPTNFSPILRNPVDHINATMGELLVYRVPDDTFYDPEDVDPRNLKMTLLTADRQPIPSDHWLQFDSKNNEFYGIPLPDDAGPRQYQLVCEDSGGLPASDSLLVVVHAPPKRIYNVEFRMTLETQYESFVHSAAMQRKFVEKLQNLFKDKNTSYIQLSSISKGSTIVSWFNTSLSVDVCPRQEIKRLESMLVNSDRTIASRVQHIMDPEFPVSAIQLQLIGTCKGRPSIQTPDIVDRPLDESSSQSGHDEYLITFIVPAVIISAMLLLAGIAACVLYRRRRTGKMNVEEDGRASYGNKGIPVIFQEELEEKPEPGTKAPVILKDEKPPLAPPEYSKSGSLKLTDDSEPYQPPPPFTRTQDNGRQARPKPTPTYRKPPPYVPP